MSLAPPCRPPFARPLLSAAASLLVVAAVLACGGDGATPPKSAEARVARLEAARTIPTRLFAGDSLPAMRVRAVDARGAPVAGATVAFRASGQSRIALASAITDSIGFAVAGAWRMSTRVGVDTLVASIPGGARLAITVPVVAGLVYELQVVQRPTTGTVGAPIGPSIVFRGRDQFGNAAAGAPVDFTVAAGANPNPAVAPASGVLDDSGYVRVEGWVPRLLGSHTLTARVRDVFAEQASIVHVVTSPACAPFASIAPSPASNLGQLGINLAAPCADSVDRWSLHVNATAVLELATTGAPMRVQRAGATGEATLVMPTRAPGIAALLLAAGDYEIVMGPRRPSDGTSYEVQLRTPSLGTMPGATCDTTWATPGAVLRHGTTCAVNRPEASLPAGSTAAAFGLVAASLPSRELRVSVTAIPVAGTQLRRVVAVYARRRATNEQQLLATLPNTATERTLVVTIPAGWDDAIVFVGHHAGENGAFDVEFR